jgi:putative hydrolase of the HAD superfamily
MLPVQPSRKIKAILFDLGKVIVDFDFRPAFDCLSRVTSQTAEEIENFFLQSGLEVLYDGGQITSSDFYKEVKKGLRHSLSYNQFKKVWNQIFTPNREIIRLIERLKTSGYRLVLISNTNAMHYAYLRETCPVLRAFDHHVLSFKEKSRKPDERIYRSAIRACRVEPHQIFYVDDREDLTEAGAALGLKVYTYKKNTGDLVKTMKAHKIRWS